MNENNLETALNDIIESPKKHSCFLALIAHLEYVGARKIAKTLPSTKANSDHLEHLMEEARHAFLLRTQAEKMNPSQDWQKHPEYFKHAESYLQSVDRGIHQCLQDLTGSYSPFSTYLVVSLIIEERAMEFYPVYHRILQEGSVKGTVHSILADEVGHLEDMQAQCKKIFQSQPEILDRCRKVEHQAYREHFLPLFDILKNQ